MRVLYTITTSYMILMVSLHASRAETDVVRETMHEGIFQLVANLILPTRIVMLIVCPRDHGYKGQGPEVVSRKRMSLITHAFARTRTHARTPGFHRWRGFSVV